MNEAIDSIRGTASALSCLCDALRIVSRQGVMDGTDRDHVVDTLIPLVAEKAEALFEDVDRLRRSVSND